MNKLSMVIIDTDNNARSQLIELLEGILFDLYTVVHNDRAEGCLHELQALVGKVEARYRVALYHQFLGNYLVTRRKFSEAVHQLGLAEVIYEEVKYDDDLARTRLQRARTYFEMEAYDKACEMLELAEPITKKLESEDIEGEYLAQHGLWLWGR